MICLICKSIINLLQLFNIYQHYKQLKLKYDQYEGLMKQEKVERVKIRDKFTIATVYQNSIRK